MMADGGVTGSAREDFCRFLSACYYEPDAGFAEERLFDSMLAAARVIDPDLAEHARKLGEAFLEQELETLLVDHCALFIGPSQSKAMPYASFWLSADPSLRQEAMKAATDFYAEAGLDVSEDLPELPDHVAIELEFLHALIHAQNEARQQGNVEALARTNELHRRFLIGHLGKWIGDFANAIRSGAETKFYRVLADLTERFVLLEKQADIQHSKGHP